MTDDRGEGRLRDAAERLRQWNRWGADDEVGTLNLIGAEQVVAGAQLVRRGAVFSLALPFDEQGPQKGHLKRFNPMLFMLRDGNDVVGSDPMGMPRGIGGADDVVIMATQGGTQWDGLGHMFYDGKMWNGYDASLVTSFGARKNDVRAFRDRIVGRAVLLDLPRHLGVPWCEPGRATTGDELDACARAQGVALRPGDILLIRFGHMTQCRQQGSWGDYAGGDAPGLAFDTLDWIAERQPAGIASDTWGVEVRPNEIPFVNQPWHRVALPSLGLLVGEIFDLDELAADCAADGVYESFFVACPLPITGAVGGPVNPIAIK